MSKNGNGNGHINNREFAATDEEFRAACARAGVEPNKRRAACWRRGTGYVYGYRVGGPNEHTPIDPRNLGEIRAREQEQLLTAAAK